MHKPFGSTANSSTRKTRHVPVSAAEMDQILGSVVAVAQPPSGDPFAPPASKKRTWFPSNHYFEQIRDEAVLDLATLYSDDVSKITTKVVAKVFWELRQKPVGGDIVSVKRNDAEGTVTITYKSIPENSVIRIDALREMVRELV